MVSDIKNLGYFNSIGGTALEVGSVKVNTINLARIAYESDTPEQYFNILKQRVEECLMCLDVVRHIIKRNVEKGLLPNYSKGIIKLANQYNSIGIIGIYEGLQHFGMVTHDEFGNAKYTPEGIEFVKQLFNVINQTKDTFAQNKDYQINIEQIPKHNWDLAA